MGGLFRCENVPSQKTKLSLLGPQIEKKNALATPKRMVNVKVFRLFKHIIMIIENSIQKLVERNAC